MGPLGEPSYRLYNCERCGVQVRICRRCDHGQIYCAAECAKRRRRESVRRAGARYQRTRRGALCHARRQRRWRLRRQEVTHQGYRGALGCAKVLSVALSAEIRPDAPPIAPTIDPKPAAASTRCAFCGAPLPVWTRLSRGPWSG